MTNLLQFTMNFRKSHSQALCNLQLVREEIACCSSQLLFAFLYAGNSIQFASQQFVSFIHIPFVTPPPPPKKNKIKSNGVRSGDSNICITVNI